MNVWRPHAFSMNSIHGRARKTRLLPRDVLPTVPPMAERSFKQEVLKLRLGAGEEFEGEGILAVTKALLQSGVSYVGGYQGSPVSHLMDVLADAHEILDELGVHFESSASEATDRSASPTPRKPSSQRNFTGGR